MVKQKIVFLIDWYEPAYLAGGPIRSLKNLACRLKEDSDISIITGLLDLRHHEGMKEVSDGMIVDRREARVFYLKRDLRFWSRLKKILADINPDILYVNGMYSGYFSLLPLVMGRLGLLSYRKLVIAPRGMLRAGDLKVKPRRKKTALFILKTMLIQHGWFWHATDDQEAVDIQLRLGVANDKISIAGNVPMTPVQKVKFNDLNPPLRLVLVSRLSTEKNIDGMISALVNVTLAVELDVYGEFQSTTYKRKVEQLMAALPNNIEVRFNGSIAPDLVNEKLEHAHFFILLTHGENFGHSIFEALAVGRPVIISRHTPWTETVAGGAGYLWDGSTPLNDIIEKISKLSQKDYELQCKTAHQAALSYYDGITTHPGYRELFSLTP